MDDILLFVGVIFVGVIVERFHHGVVSAVTACVMNYNFAIMILDRSSCKVRWVTGLSRPQDLEVRRL